MVQTNPAAALLGIKANDKGPSGSTKSSDDAAFSREFEQVSRGAESHESKPEERVEQGDKVCSPTDAARANEQEPTEQAAGTEESEQTEVAADGKNLPPVASVDEELLLKDEEVVAADAVEESLVGIQALAQQEVKPLPDAASEVKVKPVIPSVTNGAEVDMDADVDDALSFSTLRLRDLKQANPFSGKDGGGQSALSQGKANTTLFTLVNSSGNSASNFGELLNNSTVTAAPGTAPTQSTAPILPAQMTLAMPVQQSGWDQAMGERVVWMARSNIQQAQIQLNPRELGPIEIKISVQNEQTHVNFVAHHATTREAIEAALPRLREMMSEQGLNLGQADVSQHSFGDNQRQTAVGDEGRNLSGAQHSVADEESEGDIMPHESRVPLGAVDYFA